MSANARWRLTLRVCGVQMAFAVVVALIWGLFGGSALAVLIGGGAATFLTLWFGIRVFSVDAAADPEGFLRRFYGAELFKLVMAVLFFIVAARMGGDQMGEIISGFIAALVGFWFGLWPAMKLMSPPGDRNA
ncbi:ATP synthase subunit I [Natronospira bacteriovora]|uniref:ATP synthase subunit I n=1 Tax=Natronospira bacteriovora TaxID=3069753 RepID=A0ABU0W6S7_9GAMM|nr:ATP synthase subunit I [Natronospira sp. AB-CW4]MDQ2069727.1 ATP synthase subunit I [Natronospira sp. AB-CW4]